MLALTTSGPSSFTGEFYLVPGLEIEASRCGHVEQAAEAVGVASTLFAALEDVSHGLMDLKGLGLVHGAEEFMLLGVEMSYVSVRVKANLNQAYNTYHDLLGAHFTAVSTSYLFPGSAALQGLAGVQQEFEDGLVSTGLGAHADLVAD